MLWRWKEEISVRICCSGSIGSVQWSFYWFTYIVAFLRGFDAYLAYGGGVAAGIGTTYGLKFCVRVVGCGRCGVTGGSHFSVIGMNKDEHGLSPDVKNLNFAGLGPLGLKTRTGGEKRSNRKEKS
ncbi:hypothetical protein Q9L58_004034 [Maublancomyces gigas]|uniref:Uncharacterized protein n=1 Tax=Discina gigas TaxID=1032678 RepID=A0ABR3GLZ3_9PEZI